MRSLKLKQLGTILARFLIIVVCLALGFTALKAAGGYESGWLRVLVAAISGGVGGLIAFSISLGGRRK